MANENEENTEAIEIRAALENRIRSPFRSVMADWLGAAPGADDLKKFSAKSPDRWSQGVAILGRLCGYSDRLEVENDVTISRRLESLSDMEVRAELDRLTAEREALEAGATATGDS